MDLVLSFLYSRVCVRRWEPLSFSSDKYLARSRGNLPILGPLEGVWEPNSLAESVLKGKLLE